MSVIKIDKDTVQVTTTTVKKLKRMEILSIKEALVEELSGVQRRQQQVEEEITKLTEYLELLNS